MSLDRLKIKGGVPLKGTVTVHGAKNSALVLMAACILGKNEIHLTNVPRLADVEIMVDVLRSLGAKVEFVSKNDLLIDPRNINNSVAPYELVTQMRASFVVMGPLLARLGEASVSLPGGCAIGSRPVDFHLKAFQAMGAEITIEHGNVLAQAQHLKGAKVYLDFPSVGATQNAMMAACLADGTTVIQNAAMEPEIIDLADFLIALGGQVKGAGSDTIIIEGVKELNKPITYPVMPDRIEAGTFMLAAAMTKGQLIVDQAPVSALHSLIAKMQECGVQVDVLNPTQVRVSAENTITGTHIKTLPFPGFPTDMQAQFAAMLTIAEGTSTITETVFENRFMYVDEFIRMGADIRIDGRTAVIQGRSGLSGAPVQATDLRAAAALVLAGLVAEGETSVSNLEYLDRGYENFEQKLAELGARICRISVQAQKSEEILL